MADYGEIVKKYRIEIVGESLKIHPSIRKKPTDLEFIKAHKPEIMAFIVNQKEQAERARQENICKVKAIEGREELRKLESAWAVYREEYNRWVEDDCEGAKPTEPDTKLRELMNKYPRAAAYNHAENFSFSEHFAKAGMGRRAMERIRDGEDYEKVIAEMEAEWTEYCDAHVWD